MSELRPDPQPHTPEHGLLSADEIALEVPPESQAFGERLREAWIHLAGQLLREAITGALGLGKRDQAR